MKKNFGSERPGLPRQNQAYFIDRYVIAGFLKDLRARTIVPAHFGVSDMNSIYEVDDFLKLMPQGTVVARIGTDLALKAGMPKQVVVMTPLMLRKE